eukprot:9220694-Pyramimonas_sp.AAC.2
MAGRPAGRMAISASAVRTAALSEPISRAIKASMYNAAWDFYIAAPHPDINLAPVGIVPHDRDR